MSRAFVILEQRIHTILIEEQPSLLHGDLWAGNYLCSPLNEPYLIDPAVYYGHRETDLAMTRLFGGFREEFYASYMESFPLEDGWEYREDIYKLYHVLNHMNMFGAGYYPQAMSILKRYTD